MRIFFFFSLIILLNNCTTVEVAKEVTKASKSIKTSVSNLIKDNNKNKEKISGKEIIDQEIKVVEREKEKEKNIIKEQKQITELSFLGENSEEIERIIGSPVLIRVDGNSRIRRYDNSFCHLFLFSNINHSKIEYFEIRNKQGELIINKENIQSCYKNFNIT